MKGNLFSRFIDLPGNPVLGDQLGLNVGIVRLQSLPNHRIQVIIIVIVKKWGVNPLRRWSFDRVSRSVVGGLHFAGFGDIAAYGCFRVYDGEDAAAGGESGLLPGEVLQLGEGLLP